VFQTNPRGVEAARYAIVTSLTDGFRRTLVGLKRAHGDVIVEEARSFRRTLVGLKPPLETPGSRSRYPFQTNPRGIEAVELGHGKRVWDQVSDEPSWD